MLYLVKYNASVDTDFNVNGLAIVSKNLWLGLLDSITNIKQEFTIALGTNQVIYYEDGIDLIQDFYVEELTYEEATIIMEKIIFTDLECENTIKELLEKDTIVEYGIFPDIYKLHTLFN